MLIRKPGPVKAHNRRQLNLYFCCNESHKKKIIYFILDDKLSWSQVILAPSEDA